MLTSEGFVTGSKNVDPCNTMPRGRPYAVKRVSDQSARAAARSEAHAVGIAEAIGVDTGDVRRVWIVSTRIPKELQTLAKRDRTVRVARIV
jgi:hypothetical protein